MGTKRTGIVVISLLVVALISGACGGSDSGNTMTAADEAQEAPAGRIVDAQGNVVGSTGAGDGGTSGGGGMSSDTAAGYVGDQDALGVPASNEGRAAERGRSSLDIGPS